MNLIGKIIKPSNRNLVKMIYKTELSNDFQTIIPPEIRNKFKISYGDQIEWIISNNEVKLKFINKVSVNDKL